MPTIITSSEKYIYLLKQPLPPTHTVDATIFYPTISKKTRIAGLEILTKFLKKLASDEPIVNNCTNEESREKLSQYCKALTIAEINQFA
jgi:hypothetical protein